MAHIGRGFGLLHGWIEGSIDTVIRGTLNITGPGTVPKEIREELGARVKDVRAAGEDSRGRG